MKTLINLLNTILGNSLDEDQRKFDDGPPPRWMVVTAFYVKVAFELTAGVCLAIGAWKLIGWVF